LEFDSRRKALASALSALNDRERRIFEARRLAEEPITLRELADEFGVSLARAPDRRVCLREGAEVGEERRRCDGNSGASAGALASNPLQ
jgi:RNA polymerase sigma-32 factor